MKQTTKVHYRSVADLNETILKNLGKVPKDVELIVGVPRSGMLAANLLALHLNLPLVDLEGFIAGRVMAGGSRLQRCKCSTGIASTRRVLVLDDSLNAGIALREAKRLLQDSGLNTRTLYACVYVNPAMKGEVDFFFEVCETPRAFEWNLMHSVMLGVSCVDIDGVLCRDPSEEENDDGPKYQEFIANVSPIMVPTFRMGYLVTSRLEKYRAQTEKWLATHGFSYGELVMMDYPDKASRMKANQYGQFKAAVYHRTNTLLFIESSLSVAQVIRRLSGKSVFCTETREMLQPNSLEQSRRVVTKAGPFIWRRVKSRLGRLFHQASGCFT